MKSGLSIQPEKRQETPCQDNREATRREPCIIALAGGWSGARSSGDNQDRHNFLERLGTILLETITQRVGDIFNLFAEDWLNPGKHPIRVQTRSGLTHRAVTELGLSATEGDLKLGVGQSAASRAAQRVRKIIMQMGIRIEDN